MEIIKPGININFVGKRKIAYGFSLLLILLSVVLLAVHGGPHYGVDFAGGLLIQVQFQKPTNPQAIRNALGELKMNGIEIQSFGTQGKNEYLIRVPGEGDSGPDMSRTIQTTLEKQFGEGSLEMRRVEMVGPKVGQDLRQKAMQAIFYAILFILFYISGRFELKWGVSIAVAAALLLPVYLASNLETGVTPWMIVLALAITIAACFYFQLKYALGAIVALIHDVTITVGIFSLLDKEMNLTIVAALLTIVGYSLNDTIIVFDRIRENLRKTRKKAFEQIINQSINETLSRTILTSGTTLAVVLSLLFLGGPVIADFAFALMIGIVVGTYSSIYVASPILLIWPPEGPRKPVMGKSGKGGKRK